MKFNTQKTPKPAIIGTFPIHPEVIASLATKTAPTAPPIDIARAYADQIVLLGIARVPSTLRLAELSNEVAKSGISATQLRNLLSTNPERFVYHDRKWLPKARVIAAKAPVEELIRQTVLHFGAPMPIADLARELSLALGRPADRIEKNLGAMLRSDPNLFITVSGFAGLSEWLFVAGDVDEEMALFMNGVSRAELDAHSELAKLDYSDLDRAAKGALKTLPISPKIVGYFAWKQLNPSDPYAVMAYDPVALFDAMHRQTGVVFAADGKFHSSDECSSWLKKALKDAEKLAPPMEFEEAAPLEIGQAELDEFVAKILSSPNSVGASELLQSKYEISPADRTYAEDLASLTKALHQDERIWWVGGDRFRKPNSAPDFIQSIPEFFNYTESNFRDADGELIDALMSDDAFTSALRKEMSLPLAQDVLDEDPQPRQKKLPDEIRLVLKSHHREIGTFPLCQLPSGWLPDEPDIQEIVFRDPSGSRLFVWVNLQAGLLFNLLDWWFEQPVESGAVFTLKKTEYPSVYDFQWQDDPDPLVYIPSERMNELRDLAARAAELSNYEILIEVLAKHSKGADFITILSEANVVRRMTRRQVASILSGYHCFYQRSGSTVWHYDAKKVDQGFDRAKRKFVRQ